MPSDEGATAQLGAVFDELIELVGETKQAQWSASATDRHQALDALKAFLVEQVAAVDDAERRLGGRPPWILSPTGHQVRNLAAESGGDPDRLVDLLAADLSTVADDVRQRAATAGDDWRPVLSELADGLGDRIEALRRAPR